MGRLLSFSAEQPSTQNMRFVTYTMWKVSKYGVFSGPYLETFHAVLVQELNQGREQYPWYNKNNNNYYKWTKIHT